MKLFWRLILILIIVALMSFFFDFKFQLGSYLIGVLTMYLVETSDRD